MDGQKEGWGGGGGQGGLFLRIFLPLIFSFSFFSSSSYSSFASHVTTQDHAIMIVPPCVPPYLYKSPQDMSGTTMIRYHEVT